MHVACYPGAYLRYAFVRGRTRGRTSPCPPRLTTAVAHRASSYGLSSLGCSGGKRRVKLDPTVSEPNVIETERLVQRLRKGDCL